MRVFVTGATGFIGTAVVKDLIQAGHHVLGLSRSDEGATALQATGAQVHRGHLEDLESLRTGAASTDGVIHTAFIHDFSKMEENSRIDANAIKTIGDVLAGSNRPLVVSAGLFLTPGRVTTENDEIPADFHFPRVSEQSALEQAKRGVRTSIIRLPQVHDRRKAGLVTYLIAHARQAQTAAYIGDGKNRWAAGHVLDVATLYRLALEKGTAGARYHAAVEQGIPLKQIAEAIGKRFKLPVVSKSADEAKAHFGWMAFFAGLDGPASSSITQQQLGWKPAQSTGLIEDVENTEV